MKFCRCTYSITVPVNSQVLINAQSLDIECPFDKVQFGFNNDPPGLNVFFQIKFSAHVNFSGAKVYFTKFW